VAAREHRGTPPQKRQVDLEKIKNKKFKKRLAFSVNVLYIK